MYIAVEEEIDNVRFEFQVKYLIDMNIESRRLNTNFMHIEEITHSSFVASHVSPPLTT